jgi:outer membrane protein TolC
MKHRLILASLILAAAPVATLQADSAQAGPPDPLDIKAAIVYALDHNYAILQAREQIRQQEGVIYQVQAAGIPNVAALGGYERNSASISQTYPQGTSDWTAELKATQTLFAGGGVQASVRNAKLVRDAASFDLQAAIDAALLDVRTKFYNVLLTREKVRVQEENIGLFESQLVDSQNQFKAGSVSNFEVLRARVSLANAQPDLITARNDFRIAIDQLRQSLGAPAASGPGGAAFPEVRGTLVYTPESFDLDTALASAHEHRPELLSLDKLEEAGEQSVVGARSTYYPNVGLYGGYEWAGVGLAQGGSFTGSGWLVGVQSSWAIFDGRATAGKVIQAKSQLRQARLSRSQEDLAVDTDVRQALSVWQEAKELANASAQTVDEAKEALRLANSRFKAGTATQLDVLTSQVSLTQARTNEIQANYNYVVAVAAMRKAMGLGDALVGQ